MAKSETNSTAKVLTANRLDDGVAVWWTGNAWSLALEAAIVADDEAAIAALERALADAGRLGTLLDLALVDVAPSASGPVPLRLRERIRAQGPSIAYAPQAAVGAQARAA